MLKIAILAGLLSSCVSAPPANFSPMVIPSAKADTGPHVCQGPRDRDCIQSDDPAPVDQDEADNTPAEPVDPCTNRKTPEGYDRCRDRLEQDQTDTSRGIWQGVGQMFKGTNTQKTNCHSKRNFDGSVDTVCD